MSKVASAAATMGVGEDQLAAQLSTIISVTREAPETIGTSLKTIYARISDIQAGISEDGATLGNYSGKMAQFGINVLDAQGHLRDMGEVMEEIGGKWDTLNREQQVYLTQTMAGQRQYSRLLALFDNWSEYERALNTAQQAAGTLQHQQDIYMESTAAHLEVLKASIENIYNSLADTDTINGLVDGLSTVANVTASFVDSIGGGGQLLKDLGVIGVSVFSQQIAKGINTTITNFETARENARQFDEALQATKEWQGIPGLDEVSKDLLENRQQLLELARLMSPQQFSGAQELINEVTQLGNKLASLKEQDKILDNAVKKVLDIEKSYKSLDGVMSSFTGRKQVAIVLQEQEEKFKQLSKALETYRENLKKSSQGLDFSEAKTELDNYIKEIEKLQSQGLLGNHEKQIDNLKRQWEQLQNAAKMPDFSDEMLSVKMQAISSEFQAISSNVQKQTQETRKKLEQEAEQTANSITGQINKVNSELQKASGSFQKEINNAARTSTIQNYAKMASAIGQVAMGVQQIHNLGSIWSNQDLSSGEKILQTITNLTMTLPMLVSGLGTMATSLGLVTMLEGEAATAAVASGEAFEFLGMTIAVNPIFTIAAVVAGAVAALGILNSALEQARENEIKRQQAIIDDQNKTQDQIKAHEQLYSSLEQLNQQYENGQITRTELRDTIDDLIDQYGLEGEAAESLKNNYNNLEEAIKGVRAAQAKELAKSAKNEREAAARAFGLDFQGQGGLDEAFFGPRDSFSFGSSETGSKAQKYAKKILKSQKGADVEGNVITFEVDPNSEQELIKFYEKVQSFADKMQDKFDADQLSNVKQYQDAIDFLEQYGKRYNTLKDAIKESNEYQSESILLNNKNIDFDNIETGNQYYQQRLQLIEKIRKSTKVSQEEAQELADQVLSKNYGDLYGTYDETIEKLDKIKEKFGDSTDDVLKYLDQFNNAQFEAFLNLDLDSIKNWETLEETLKKISETDFSNVKDFSQNIEAMKETAADNFAFYQSLEDQVAEGKGVSKTTMKSLSERGGGQLQEYFDIMANGTYQLTGDAQQFYEAITRLKLDGFFDTIDAIQERITALGQLSQKSFNYNDLNQSALSGVAFDFKQGTQATYDYELLQQQVDYLETIGAIQSDQIVQWETLIENQRMSVDVCEDIANAVEQAGDQTQDLEGRTGNLQEQIRDVERAIHDALFPVDEDINETVLGELSTKIQEIAEKTQEFSNALSDGTIEAARSADELAESILRFDNAIEDVVDNYDTWLNALNSGSIQEQAEVMSSLRDAYADMLNIDGSSLTDSFLTNVEYLNLMQAAIDGDIDAYNHLQDAASQDILAQVGLNTSGFEQDVNNLLEQYYGIQSLDDVEVGARFDNQDFLNALTELARQSGMTVDQVNDTLSLMGMDAEVIEDRTETTEQSEITGWTQTAKTISGPSSVQYGDGTGVAVANHENVSTYFESTPTYTPVAAKKQNVAFALKVTAAGKSTGGDVKFKQARHGGGSVGTARRAAAAQASNKEAEKAAEQARKQQQKAAKQAERQQKQAQRQAQKAQRQAEQAQKKAQREAEQAAKKAQRQAQKAQKEWEKENSDTSQKDQKELIKDERDIYHDINVQIKQVDRQLQRVQKRQQRLYGKDLLANLNKQTEILEKHKKKLLEKQSIQQGDLRDQQQQLRNLGAMFDFYGNITNYMDVVAQKQNRVNQLTSEYNNLVGLYNSSTNRTYKEGISNQMDALSKELDKAKTSLSDTKKAITDYDNLRESIEDITDQVEEETQKQIEINITKFRMELEIRLEMGQAERDWNEFRRKVIDHTDIIKDSDFSKLFKDANLSLQNALSYYNVNGSKGSLQTLTEQLERTKEQLDEMDRTGTSSIYGDNRQKLMEDLQNDTSKLMQQLGEINDYVDSIDEAYMEYIDIAKNMFDKQISDYQFISGLLEHDMDLLKLLYGQKTYDAMGRYYEKLNANHRQELDLLRRQADYWKERWDTAQGQQDAKKFEQNYRETINKIQDEIAKSAKNLQAEFTNAVNGIFYNLESQLTGGKGLDYVDLEWDLINKKADQYLDTINSAFAIQELEGKFNEALNVTNTKNIKAQQAIKKLMGEQLDYLKGKQRVSQYEVDYATKLLEVEQARAALEDARSEKTSMRLKRDAQGNYSYEYTANEENVLEAQQNLATAQNELYNFNKDAYKSNLEDAYAAYKDYKQKQLDLAQRIMKGEKEAEAELLLLRQQYGEIINNYAEQNQRIRINLKESAIKEYASLYKLNESNFNTMTENEKEMLIGKLLPAWEGGIQQMIDAFAGNGGFLTVCHDSFDALADITYDYQVQLRDLSRDAGRDLNQVQRGVNSVAAQFGELIIDNNELVSVMDREAEALTTLQERAHALTDEYNAVYHAAMSAVSGIHAELQAERDKAAAQAAAEAAKNASTISTDSYFDSNYFGGGGDGIAMVGDIVTFSGQYYHDSWGRNPAGSKYSGVEGGVMIDDYSSVAYGGRASNTGDYDVHIKSADGRYPDLGWIRLSQLRGFASGGYTGSWIGDEGKIGILHQKELVLNQQDTQNILDSVNILRSLMDGINSNMMVKLSGLKSGSYNPFANNETIEQNVHIDASFPNVNSRREIEEAFSNLANVAAQRALRR